MRSGPAALQGSVRLGRSAFGLAPTAHSAHIWPPCKRKGGVRIGLYVFAFAYSGGQTSHTPRTLCAICPNIFLKYKKNKLTRINNYVIMAIGGSHGNI
jgi:hypothetical protein